MKLVREFIHLVQPFNTMKIKSQIFSLAIAAATLISFEGFSQTTSGQKTEMSAEQKIKSDADQENKASEWVSSLNLKDAAKEVRVKKVIATHLKSIRDWHNEHPFTTVPAGINPLTGNKLSELERQIIANSAMPETVHKNLMEGLRKDLTEEQVEAILDKHTVGKVAFTLNAYKAIVPNLTAEEEATLLKNLKQAREQAMDFKNMNQISAIFEIYKTKNEQYLNSNGRSWKQMYKDFTNATKMKKAAEAEAKKK